MSNSHEAAVLIVSVQTLVKGWGELNTFNSSVTRALEEKKDGIEYICSSILSFRMFTRVNWHFHHNK